MFEFLKRMFGKKEVPHTVVEPVQPIVVAQPISTSAVEAAPAVKKAKPRNKAKTENKTVDVNHTTLTAWPFEEPVKPKKKTTKKVAEIKPPVPAMTATAKKKKSASVQPTIKEVAKKKSVRSKKNV